MKSKIQEEIDKLIEQSNALTVDYSREYYRIHDKIKELQLKKGTYTYEKEKKV